MHPSRTKQFISILLIAAGACLLFQGARIFFASRLGQTVARKEFQQPEPPRAHRAPVRPQLGDTVAKLLIPRLGTQLYVVEGVDAGDLRRGPGHMPGTAMPGTDGNCVIAAHRDTHFRVLKDIKEGDDIILQTHDGEFLYRVKNTHIVLPTNTASIQRTSTPELHLITCYPFYYVGNAPKRFIVKAELAGSLTAGSLSASLIPHS